MNNVEYIKVIYRCVKVLKVLNQSCKINRRYLSFYLTFELLQSVYCNKKQSEYGIRMLVINTGDLTVTVSSQNLGRKTQIFKIFSNSKNGIQWHFWVKWVQGKIWLNMTDFTWDISEHNSWILPSNKKKLIWISFMKRFNLLNHCNFYINPSLILLWLEIIFQTTF